MRQTQAEVENVPKCVLTFEQVQLGHWVTRLHILLRFPALQMHPLLSYSGAEAEGSCDQY